MLFERLRSAGDGTSFLTQTPPESTTSTAYLMQGFRFCGFLLASDKHPQLSRLWMGLSVSMALIYMPLSYFLSLEKALGQSMGQFLMTLQLVCNAVSGMPRFFFLHRGMGQLLGANDLLHQLDEHCRQAEQQRSLAHVAASGNRIFMSYFIIYECFVLCKLIMALCSGQAMINLYSPFVECCENATAMDILKQTLNDYFILQYGVIIVMLIDAYPTIYIANLRQHLRLLRLRVLQLGSDKSSAAEQRLQQLVFCVQSHRLLLKYRHILRPLISVTTVLQFLVCGSALGITLVHLMFFADLMSIVGNFPYLVMLVLQTLPLCYVCDCVEEENQQLANAIMHTDWMYESPGYRKVLLFFLQNVLAQPLVFKAYIFPINLRTNSAFSKFAFTVCTLAQKSLMR